MSTEKKKQAKRQRRYLPLYRGKKDTEAKISTTLFISGPYLKGNAKKKKKKKCAT